MCFKKKILGDIPEKIYDDGCKETVSETGKVLALIPRTIHASLSKLERWVLNREYSIKMTQRLLENKLEHFNPEEIEELDPFVAVPAINALSYSASSEDLLDMYANLLATSMISDKKWLVHPSFVEIIKQLSPDEAKLLKAIASCKNDNEFPLVDLVMKKDIEDLDSFGSTIYYIIRRFTNLGDGLCEYPERICSYIENLVRFNIIEILESNVLTDGSGYYPLTNHPLITKTKNSVELRDGFEWEINQYIFMVTNFGNDFISSCVLGPRKE